MDLKALSLFCGCGGLDWGFHQNGVQIVAALDNDKSAIDCYNYNFGQGGICMDVQTPEFKKLISGIGKIDIVLGGFPCQGFSKSGPKKIQDPRNTLYKSMLYAIETLRPSIFVAENVDGLAQNYKGEFLSQIFNDFTGLGYQVEYKIIDAADFGVPQHRRRIVFIGSLFPEKITWPSPLNFARIRNGEFISKDLLKPEQGLFAPQLAKAVTMKDGIGDLINKELGSEDHIIVDNIRQEDYEIIRNVKEGQKLCNVRFSNTSVYTWQIPQVYGAVSKREIEILETIAKNRRKKVYGNIPNGNPLPLEEISRLLNTSIDVTELKSLEKRGYVKEMEGKYDIKGAMFCSGLYKRPLWNEPSPTIITLFFSPRYLVHPSKDRPLTIRECARLQSFPDNFYFLSSGISIQDSYRLIGNAVPPKLASQIAENVINYIKAHTQNEAKTTIKRQRLLA